MIPKLRGDLWQGKIKQDSFYFIYRIFLIFSYFLQEGIACVKKF